MSTTPDPRIDAYIAEASAFARPILTHLRELLHKGCPEVIEDFKWGRPFFLHHGILCGMSAFKAHCSFGFWHQGMTAVNGRDVGARQQPLGSLARITSLADLPDDRAMLGHIRQAVKLNESGAPALPPRRPRSKQPKTLTVPDDLAAALKKNKKAAETFEEFSYTNRKNYVEWVASAKLAETRAKRLASTMKRLSEGRKQNWEYEDC